MDRVLQTTDHFGIRVLVCVNKADLFHAGVDEIESLCRGRGIEIIGHIPFDEEMTKAMVQGEPITAYKPESPASLALRELWKRVLKSLRDQ